MKTSVSISITHEHEVYLKKGDKARRLYVLLHGFSQTGQFLYKKLIDIIPKDSIVVSPNAPFLYPIEKNNEFTARYAWYFYDSTKDSFYINYEPGAEYLKNIIENFNPHNLPVTLIGYSQGGYIAPKVCELLEIDTVIGIACKFRSNKFEYQKNTIYHQIHAKNDEVVIFDFTKEEFDKLKAFGNEGEFISLNESSHRLDENYIKHIEKLILNNH